MALLILSDLHIHGAEDPLYAALLKVLDERVKADDDVVLAGDIFDLFVGPKPVFQERYSAFFRAARAATDRGARIHYIEGNHDFLLPDAFWDAGIQVLPERFILESHGKRFIVLHGDLANPHDHGYRFLRWFFRSAVMRFLVWVLPGSWLDWIGRMSSRYSRGTRAAPVINEGPGLEALRKTYRNFAADALAQGADFVVMGHCHDLDEMSFTVEGRPGQYINVGFPPVHKSMLVWNPGDEKISREPLPSCE